MNNKKAIRLLSIIILLLLCIYVAAMLLFPTISNTNENKLAVSVYYLNSITNKIEPETRYVEKGENTDIARSVLNLLYEGPKNTSLVKTLPNDIKDEIEKIRIVNDSLLEVEFSEKYKNILPMTELFFRGSLVWTMTDLSFIDNVHIYVGGKELLNDTGKPIGLLNRQNVIIDAKISSEKVETQWLKLYFANSNNKLLTFEERPVEVKELSVETCIIEELIKGPTKEGLLPTIPHETVVRDIKLDETTSTCYVNLSNDFVLKHTGDATAQKITIYSIVNSLTEPSNVKNVKKVQFLIESEKITNFNGGFDLTKPLSRDESLIIND